MYTVTLIFGTCKNVNNNRGNGETFTETVRFRMLFNILMFIYHTYYQPLWDHSLNNYEQCPSINNSLKYHFV